jgi:HSP20 family molecular chaperone IbpA
VKFADVKATFYEGVLEVKVPVPVTAAALPPLKVEISDGEKKGREKAA